MRSKLKRSKERFKRLSKSSKAMILTGAVIILAMFLLAFTILVPFLLFPLGFLIYLGLMALFGLFIYKVFQWLFRITKEIILMYR